MPTTLTPAKFINVAVAVIAFSGTNAPTRYLLARRHAHQHQGNRFEFVGGKIETGETPRQALLREVYEELGVQMADNGWARLGVICHDYGDQRVSLHVFYTQATAEQYTRLQGQGSEGQALVWATRADISAGNYPLPAANTRIVDWLALPNVIGISRDIAAATNALLTFDTWLDVYTHKLPQHAWLYVRLPSVLAQSDGTQAYLAAWQALHTSRPDVTFLLSYQAVGQLAWYDCDHDHVVLHLNHHQLMGSTAQDLPPSCRYFASCHDANSLSKINQLAQTHTVMGAFLSPVLPTPTHPDAPTLGWQGFGHLAASSQVPIFALGGIGIADIAAARAHDGYGVAGIRLLDAL